MSAQAASGSADVMMSEGVIRVADVFFTILLALVAVLGVLLAWATGDLTELTVAMLLVGVLAPLAYRPRRQAA